MFTAMSLTPEQRRIFLIGAAAAAAIILTVSAVQLASSSSYDKPLSKRRLLRMSTEVRKTSLSLSLVKHNVLNEHRKERRALTTTLRQRADAAAHADDGDLERAAELYTRALAAATATDDADASLVAGLHTNRAWCYANMHPPRHREVVRDCDAALALDPRDAMAVLRRSIAREELKAMGEK